jgi:hypothetical protein
MNRIVSNSTNEPAFSQKVGIPRWARDFRKAKYRFP